MGHLQPNQNWGNPLNTNLTCPSNKLTPFDSYYGSSNNTQHTSFTKESVDWLLKELAGQPQAPSFPIEGNQLTGASAVCLGVNATYTFEDICKIPSSATWTVSSNLQIVSSTGYSVIVKGLSNGNGTITATFQNGLTETKTIWVGLSSFPQLITYSNIPYDSTLQNGPYYNPVWIFGTFNANDLVEEFIFKDLLGNIIISKYANGGNVEVSASELGIGYGATLSFYVYTKNACGEINPIKKSSIKSTIYYPTLCQYGIGQGCGLQKIASQTSSFYKIYPNPTNDIVNISLVDETLKPVTTSVIMAELYDIQGQPRRNIQIKNNIASISVAGLPKGIYILNINIDEITEGHQVIVE